MPTPPIPSTTTTRQCIHVKSLKHRETGADEEFEEPADPGENLEDLRIMTETQQTIREAVEQLSGRCRDLIEMLYFDQRSLSYEEISQKMGMPVASIGPTRARCLDKLRTLAPDSLRDPSTLREKRGLGSIEEWGR